MVKNYLYVPSDFTNCRNCGAPIPTIIRGHCTCSYCGTTYTRGPENVVVVENRTGILPLNVEVRIRQRLVGLGDEAWNECARKEMAARLADAIVDKIDISERFDYFTGDKILKGRIRILDKEFSFD